MLWYDCPGRRRGGWKVLQDHYIDIDKKGNSVEDFKKKKRCAIKSSISIVGKYLFLITTVKDYTGVYNNLNGIRRKSCEREEDNKDLKKKLPLQFV